MFLLELIYFLAVRKKKSEEVTRKCWADFSPGDSPGGDAGEGQEIHGAQGSPKTDCIWAANGQRQIPAGTHTQMSGSSFAQQGKKYFYNCSSCGLWWRWITNLQPLVFGEKQTVLFWGKNQEPKIIQAFLFIRPEWGQKSISLCALSPFNDETLTICANKYGLVCI